MHLKLRSDLTAPWLEDHPLSTAGSGPSQLELPPEPMRIAIGSWRRTRLLAEGRLLGSLGAVQQTGRGIDIDFGRDLPRLTPEEAAETHDDRWRLLRDELASWIIATFADRIADRDGADRRAEILDAQHRALAREPRFVTHSGAVAAPAVDSARAPAPHAIFALRPRSTLIERRETVYRALDDIVVRTTAHRRGLLNLGGLSGTHTTRLVDFVHEAIENTRDHAMEDLALRTTGGLRFLLVRRLGLHGSVHENLRAGAGSGELAGYLDALAAWRDALRLPLVEVTVADSGIGIPARLSGDPQIYDQPIERERAYLTRAMDDDSSSKGHREAGAGLGLGIISSAVDDLGGFLSIRTGRLELMHNALNAPGVAPQIAERCYVRGTAVSLLLPWQLSRRRARAS